MAPIQTRFSSMWRSHLSAIEKMEKALSSLKSEKAATLKKNAIDPENAATVV